MTSGSGTSLSFPSATPSRSKLRAAIPRRMKVGPTTALLLALGFALLVTPVMRIDNWLQPQIRAGQPAPVTVRVKPFIDPAPGGGAIVIARGEIADARAAAQVAYVRASQPRGVFGDFAYFAVALTLAAIYTMQLRRSNKGRFLRTQVVLLGTLLVVAAGVKALMLLTAVSVLAVPVALLALATAMALDREAGVATGVLASVLVGLLVPFDIGVTAILLVQALTASLLLPDRIRRRWRVGLTAGVGAAITAVLAYGIVHYLTRGTAPFDELTRPGASSWVAAAVGGSIAALLAVPSVPVMQVMCGEITDGTLISLEDLSHPLLKQISDKAPGTWQHSLAMANMAEIAANAIGANGRLVRVGAYFHDLGKSLHPKYFIENVESGEQSPHDRLPPEQSCDAIFGHVTEGIVVARRQGLPERIIDFMHMHHGDGVLEYFWAKCQDQGNPNGLTTEDFRYPGVPPQSRETAILAICDAVEAASRTLRRPDQQAINSLVQRIVYGKLHLGQLDESGLSMADLRKINDSLRETIKHAHHGRIEYPWQKAEREAEAREQATVQAGPRGRDSITQRIMEEPRLDSLDAPRPPWAAGGTGPGARPTKVVWPGDAAGAATVPVAAPPLHESSTVSLRPGSYADSVDVAHAATAQRTSSAADPEDIAFMNTGQVRIAHAVSTERIEPPPPAPEAPEPKPQAEIVEAVVAEPPRWSGTFAAAAEDALEVVASQTSMRKATPWGARLADKIDDMLGAEEAGIDENSDIEELPPSSPGIPLAQLAGLADAGNAEVVPEVTNSQVASVADIAAQAEAEAAAAADAADEATAHAETAEITAVREADADADADGMAETAEITAVAPPRDAIAEALADATPAEATVDADDAIVESSDAVPEHADPTATSRRHPPPPPRGRADAAENRTDLAPPGGHRRPKTTLEVDGDDVEAAIDLAPQVRPQTETLHGTGPIVGPPPATRAAPPARAPEPDVADDGDDEVTVVPRPASSMLPPRARTHGKPRE